MKRNTTASPVSPEAAGPTARFTVSIAPTVARRFEEYWKREGFPTRSEAVESLLQAALVRSEWSAGRDDVAGVVSLVYDHHEQKLVGALIDIQHDFDRLVVAAQHAHLDHDNCLETIILRGPAAEIRRFVQRLRSLKGLKHLALMEATTGHSATPTRTIPRKGQRS